MSNKLKTWLPKIVFIFAALNIYSVSLSSQSISKEQYKNGWDNALGFGFGTNNEFDSPYELEGTLQVEYALYKFLNPKFALGGGLSIAMHAGLYGYHNSVSTHYFGDIFIYSKYYLLDKRHSPFLDLKLGYGTGLNSVKFNTDLPNNSTGVAIFELLPGYMIQSGLGLEIKSFFGKRVSMKLSPYLIQTARRVDRKIYIGAIIFTTSLYF